jgi:ubiquinone/menaquinone biosynthesis C-methylase UbiE
MSASRSGSYPIERRHGEIDRLDIQAAALAAETDLLLDRIGVAPGWACLDLGCGPGGIVENLARRVAGKGRVVGLDSDPVFLKHARSRICGAEFVEGDAYATGLPGESFDLVHMRFIAGTAGAPERLLAEAIRLARPGGAVALQEADISTLHCCPTHPAWDRLRDALEGVFAAIGADPHLGQRLFALVRQAGLEDVQYRPFLVGVRSCDPLVDYLPSTVESVRAAVLARGAMNEPDLDRALAECRAHLRKPDTVFTMYTVAQVWGRRPAGQIDRAMRP